VNDLEGFLIVTTMVVMSFDDQIFENGEMEGWR
jgi:hypothetical protein